MRRITMHRTLSLQLVLPALVFGLACDAQQTALPTDGNATAEISLSGSRSHSASKATIVLIHGAWADASGWEKVIPLLEREGFTVRAVQNPLTSLPNDVMNTKRVLDAASAAGPVIAVAHSYGATVLTEAAAGNSAIKALVFLSAFTPEAGEPFGKFLQQFPTPLATALSPEADFVYIDVNKFHDVFAADLPEKDTRVMAVTQKPLAAAILGQAPSAAAWHTIPSWYLITLQDQAISPDLQRLYARRMNAHITELQSSHVSFLSHPHDVARLIIEAANIASK
jgi:pimeloyl-ACP methyl ester carboxylesterase